MTIQRVEGGLLGAALERNHKVETARRAQRFTERRNPVSEGNGEKVRSAAQAIKPLSDYINERYHHIKQHCKKQMVLSGG